jgi:hypothetical protein
MDNIFSFHSASVVDESGDELMAPSLPDVEDIDDGRVSELNSILSVMHASESGVCAPYDPSGKFAYQTTEEQELHHEVDEKCRIRMLEWMAKVSYRLLSIAPRFFAS